MSDDAIRGASKVGSLADDGLRGSGKLGSLGDDALRSGKGFGNEGLRAGKYGTLADDGLHGARGAPAPHGDAPVGLVEEASVGAKAESHAGDVAEFGVDVSLEVISNAPDGDNGDDSAENGVSGVGNEPGVNSVQPQKVEPNSLLRARSRTSQPAFAPVLPASTKAFQHIFGRPDQLEQAQKFAAITPIPAGTDMVVDPIRWLKGRLANNPITFVFYSTDVTGLKRPIPLVLPNGGLTDDTAVHRACMEHYSHCIIFVCKPEKAGAKSLCAKTVYDQWQGVAAKAADLSLSDFVEKLVRVRENTPALREVAMSRVDLSAKSPHIVRSRLKAQTK